ncbi:MAG: LLM class flavin-dependent oxidoreductase, partial [Acidimicrobiia bacterium]|nr:LLM class flavin-dependent oxidoreductase [Acidimicrobiia bacterium]
AYNREMFEEAHDFIVKAWTTPGPWRYEGKHFHYRHVNPWPLPFQKPHPPMMIPGVLSPETVLWCAERGYPYLGLGTALGPTTELWDYYADKAAELGYQAGPENFGYLIPTFVADTEEKAQEIGKGFVWGGGQTAFSRPEYTLPPGYNSRAAIQRLAKTPGGTWLGVNREKLMAANQGVKDETTDFDEVRQKLLAGYQRAQDNYQLMIGTPDQVIAKARVMLEVLRPGTFVFFGIQGPVSNEDRQRSLELTAKYVMPEIKAYADELGLPSPFDRTPGDVKLRPGQARSAVVDKAALDHMR